MRNWAVLALALAIALLWWFANGDDVTQRHDATAPTEQATSDHELVTARPATETRRVADESGKGRIFGVVSDDTGVPIPAVTVVLDSGVEVVTDAEGKFSIAPIAVDDAATRKLVTRHDSLPPAEIEFLAWQEETEVQLKLYRPVAIDGLVVDHTGAPVKGVTIRTKDFTTESGNDGVFRILGKRGHHPLTVETPPGMFVPHSIRAQAPGEIRIVVRPIPPSRTFRFTLRDARSDERVAAKQVTGFRDRLGLFKRSIRFVPEEDGGRVEDLTPGRWVLRIETEAGWAAIHRLEVGEADPTPATIRIAPPVTLYGRVRVHRVPRNQRPHWLWLRKVPWAQGRYEYDGSVSNVPRAGWRRRGQFPVSHLQDYGFIVRDLPAGATLRMEANANGWYGAREVTLPYEDEADVTIHVQPAGKIEVVRSGGDGMRSIEYAVRSEGEDWPPYTNRWTQARTIFGVWLPPGPVEWRIRYWPFEGTDFKTLTGTTDLEPNEVKRFDIEMR